MDPVTPVASPTLPVATVAIPAVVRASTAAAVEPALSSPVIQRPAPEQAPRHNAQVLLLLLFLAVVLGIVAFVFNRPKPSHVLILTPESSSVAMVGGSTAIVGVGVEGATDGLVWSVEEKNGGRVEPGGVTIQGSRIIYHAIYHAPFRGGSYHITAASRENKDQAVTIRVDVGGK